MRWKLLLIASLLTALVGAGLVLAVVFALLGDVTRLSTPDFLVLTTLSIPLILVTVATVFVYRHTARRRALQAILTAILALSLTILVLFASLRFFAAPAPQNICWRTPPKEILFSCIASISNVAAATQASTGRSGNRFFAPSKS